MQELSHQDQVEGVKRGLCGIVLLRHHVGVLPDGEVLVLSAGPLVMTLAAA